MEISGWRAGEILYGNDILTIKENRGRISREVVRFFKEEKQSDYNEFLSNNYITFLAMVNNEVAGVAAMSTQMGTAELNYIYVCEPYRQKGIATKLFDKIKSESAKKKYAGLRVNWGQENKTAQVFYRKRGMFETGRVNNYFSNNNAQIFFWMKV